jgi:hypothetical protein
MAKYFFVRPASVMFLFAASLSAMALDSTNDEFFERSIKPILSENCFKCHSHSADKIKGGLVVDSLGGLVKGGDSGPAIVPGKPEESLLIKAISYADEDLKMPPKGKKLSSDEIEKLNHWVKMGAPWPGGKVAAKVRGKITDEDRSWWAFQPVRKVPAPSVEDENWAKNPLDKFVFARLQKEGLAPSAEADRRTLIRRVYFDLWGMPPSVQEVNSFLHDDSAGAYEAIVDRLLDHPRYGERWARQWLDLVRFAESDGYKADSFRPHAWRYRDYVIKSFNNDKPYNQFVQEQLAGDELAPDNPDALTGTMFLRHGIYEYNNPDPKGQWEIILNELTDVTGDVFIGMGLSCAKCHDHKFDPILQKDYYRFQAFFAPLLLKDDVPLASPEEKSVYALRLAQWEEMTKETREELAKIEDNYRSTNMTNAVKKFPEDIQELIFKPLAQRTPYEQQISDLAYLQVIPAFEQLETKLKGKEKDHYVGLRKKLAEFDKYKPQSLPVGMTVAEVTGEPPVYIPKSRNKEPIAPGFLSVLNEKPAEIPKIETAPHSSGRRSALAAWITSPQNPLAARVMVNRLWQNHFGRGLVATTSDFGHLGQPPTHPELLDWLASEFVNQGWSVKTIQRLILTSATYRQTSLQPYSQAALRKDPENLLLWRMNTRRLDADQVRDSLLLASSELDETMGGPSVDFSKPRRSIYTKTRRNTHDPLLQAFDAPDNISSTPGRNITTTPTQALLMFNSQPVLQHAQVLAARLDSKLYKTDPARVAAAFRQTLGRKPESWEAEELVDFLQKQKVRIARDAAKPKPLPFLSEPLPARDGKAALIEGPITKFEVPADPSFPEGDFTIEAVILLKSLGEAGIRTIAAHSSGASTQDGWVFGVTGRKAATKPQRLVLELSSNAAQGGSHELIISDLELDLNRTYYVAASVKRGETNQVGIAFYLKNLANDEDPVVSHVAHKMTIHGKASVPLTIGSVAGDAADYQFQGLVDEVRLTAKALEPEQLLIRNDELSPETIGYWQLKTEKDFFRDRSPRGNNIQRHLQQRKTEPARAALEDLCHVLVNSNEFFYVD